MTHRSTARVLPPARRSRGRGARGSLAVAVMVLGLVLGAFAAPSTAADGDTAGTAIDQAASTMDQDAPTQDNAPEREAPQSLSTDTNVATADRPCEAGEVPGVDDCENVPAMCDELTDVPPCDEQPDECPNGDFNGELPGCEPIETECPAGTVEGENGECVTEEDDEGPVPTPCLPPGKDYNGPNVDGCGTKPSKPRKPGKPGTTGGTVGGTTGGPGGSTGGSSSPGTLGTTLGVAEGSVPGSEGGAAVSACGDAVICQSAPATTSTGSTGSSVEGLPGTGAPQDSGRLLTAGLGLLLAGGVLLKPGRRGRHRLVTA